MYATVAFTCEHPTLNAPYPFCHSNPFNPHSACNHRDEPLLILCIASATLNTDGKANRRCA